MQIRKERPRFFFFSALFLLLLISPVLIAQTDTGSVTGTVTDPSGAVLSNATVTLKNIQTNAVRTFQTGPDGAYVARGLLAGTYQISITTGGFQPFIANVEVTVGGYATVDAKLSVKGAPQVVQVLGAGGVAINTQTQETSQVVGPQQLTQLPSLTRNPYDFVEVSGNVSNRDNTTPGGSQNGSSRGVGFSLNGQRESGTEILLDGVENEDIFGAGTGLQIPVDAVQEFRVITNNFDVQYGRASGGVVNIVSKAGMNQFHAPLFPSTQHSASPISVPTRTI